MSLSANLRQLGVIGAVTLASLAAAGPAPARPAPRTPPRAEAVYAIEAGKALVRIRVSSNGCTHKEDFSLRTVSKGRPRQFALMRMAPDRCKSFAVGSTWLEFGYDELGLARGEAFTLTNPLTAWNGPGE